MIKELTFKLLWYSSTSPFLKGFTFQWFKNLLYKGGIEKSLSYDVASGSEITPWNKIDNLLLVYKFTGNVMTSITTLRS